MSDDDGLPPGLALSWGVQPSHRRGPKPAFTVAQFVAAAIELADRDGVEALSLPRIAQHLGLTTTALYRYVHSKGELVVLIVDAGWGRPPATVDRARTWRTGAAAWCRGMMSQLVVHPWLLDLPVHDAPRTPNTLRWLESFLRAMSRSGLSPAECLRCALLLDGFTRSSAQLARDLNSTPAAAAQARRFLAPRLHGGDFPILAGIVDSGDYEGEYTESDVEFGLTRILDGIAKLIADR